VQGPDDGGMRGEEQDRQRPVGEHALSYASLQ
jgi:hypothetical protein